MMGPAPQKQKQLVLEKGLRRGRSKQLLRAMLHQGDRSLRIRCSSLRWAHLQCNV